MDSLAHLGLQSAENMAKKVEALYREGHTDYWLPPIVLANNSGPMGRVRAGDSLVFCCRRGEREIQLTRAFVDERFTEFPRQRLMPFTFLPLTLYHPSLQHLEVAFPPHLVTATLGEVVSQHGLRQLRLAEEEKYAHVTYFFNGGRALPLEGELDQLVPSYLQDPPQSLPLLVNALKDKLATQNPALVVVNLATGDIVGHSTELDLKIHCAEAVDHALQAILGLAQERGYCVAITADHGLIEDHGLPDGPPNNSHTAHPVPFILVDPKGKSLRLVTEGILADVAPTLLALLGLPQPLAMTGHSLLREEALRADKSLLVILDGWGLGDPEHLNPIELADTPCWNELSQQSMTRLEASGEAVGLLPGRKGNSEAGHMNLGAGRVILQDEVRIQQAINSGIFAENAAFHRTIEEAQARGGEVHLLGLLSDKSSHGSLNYVLELLKLARRKKLDRVFVHFITDGRSTQPASAPTMLRQVGKQIREIGVGTVTTLIGRGLALDRGGNYIEKTQAAYRALVLGDGISVWAD